MSHPPDDVPKKLLKKLQRARRAKRVADEMFDEVIKDVIEAKSEKKPDDAAPEDKESKNPHDEAYYNFGEDSRLSAMLFMDIVGYSRLASDDQQRDIIQLLNQLVLRVLGEIGCPVDDVICLPTGDGMCLCFASPERALLVAEGVQRDLQAGLGGAMKLRMGIHCGNVLRVTDLKGWFTLAGHAINTTQRAMGCGDEGHILCTKEAYDIFERRSAFKKSLNPIGKYEVKHGHVLELYNYVCTAKKVGNPTLPQNKKASAGKVNQPQAEAGKSLPRAATKKAINQ